MITGGCGYVGTVLTETLLNDGHHVTVLDTKRFGNHLKPHNNLVNIKGDVRDIERISLEDVVTIIHLANIVNNPAVELNHSLLGN